MLKTEVLLKKGQFSEALPEIERGLILKHTTELIQLQLLGYRAQAFILLNDVEGSKESLRQAQEIVDQQKFIPPFFIAPYLVAHFELDIQLLKNVMVSNDGANLSKLQKKAHQSGKAALRKLKNYALSRTKILRLMGEYYMLIGKQKKALKLWNKSIKDAEKLGSKLHLSRTYFEIGKSLQEPNSKYKDLNGITAEEYLEKARTMFEEMDLQWDLDELDRVMAER